MADRTESDFETTVRYCRLDTFGPFVLKSQAYEAMADLTADLMIAQNELASLRFANYKLTLMNERLMEQKNG